MTGPREGILRFSETDTSHEVGMFKHRWVVAILLSAVALVVGGQVSPMPIQAAQQPAAAAPSRELLDRYCVTCHNDRLLTAFCRSATRCPRTCSPSAMCQTSR